MPEEEPPAEPADAAEPVAAEPDAGPSRELHRPNTIAEWDATRIARLVLTAACLGVISTERLRAIRARARA